MKAIIFARVSTQEQMREGHSIPAQISSMRDYCRRKNLTIKSEYQIDESSTKDTRKKFDAVIAEIKQEKECVALVVETVDRLQRSFRETPLLDELRRLSKVELHFIREGLVMDKDSNSTNKFRWNIGVLMAENYVAQLSDNVKRSIEQKKRMGQWISKAPYGYRNIVDSNGKKDIELDPLAAGIVKKAFELYASGAYSFGTLRDKLNKDHGLKWSNGHLDSILKNPFYYGQMLITGKLYQHKYPTCITKPLFDRVQEIKSSFRKKKFKYAGLPYLYRGLIRCEACGLSITPEKHKGHVYYHCTQANGKHGAQWIREENLTEQFANLFARMQISQAQIEEVLAGLKVLHEGKIQFQVQESNALEKKRTIIQNRIDALYMEKLDGSITGIRYDEYYHSFREELAEIDARLHLLQDAEDNYFLTANYLLKLAARAHELFISSEVEQKRQIVKLVLSNLLLSQKKLVFTVVEPFNTILISADRSEILPNLDSNQGPRH